MIGSLGALMGEIETENAPFGGSGGDVGGPTNVKLGGNLQANPWSREGMLLASARTSVAGSYRADKAAMGLPAAKPAVIKAVAPEPVDEGLSRSVIIGGAAVIGLGVIGAIVYKLRKRR